MSASALRDFSATHDFAPAVLCPRRPKTKSHGYRILANPTLSSAPLEDKVARNFSNRLPRLQLVDHAPNAVAFPAFDHLQRSGAVKRLVWSFQPFANVAGFHDVGQAVEQARCFPQLHFCRRAGFAARRPLIHRPQGIPGQPGQIRPHNPVAPAESLHVERPRYRNTRTLGHPEIHARIGRN